MERVWLCRVVSSPPNRTQRDTLLTLDTDSNRPLSIRLLKGNVSRGVAVNIGADSQIKDIVQDCNENESSPIVDGAGTHTFRHHTQTALKCLELNLLCPWNYTGRLHILNCKYYTKG